MEPTTTALIEKLDSRASQEVVDAMNIRLESNEARMKEMVDSLDSPSPDATLERKGIFDDIMAFEVWGVPVGQAAVGGFVAIFASELIDGFMSGQPAWQRGLVKLGGAAVAGMWGKRFLGSTGSKAVALLLAFDALRDLSPVDSWADQLAEKISGTVTTKGLAGPQSGGQPLPVNTGRGAGQNFYSLALGG